MHRGNHSSVEGRPGAPDARRELKSWRPRTLPAAPTPAPPFVHVAPRRSVCLRGHVLRCALPSGGSDWLSGAARAGGPGSGGSRRFPWLRQRKALGRAGPFRLRVCAGSRGRRATRGGQRAEWAAAGAGAGPSGGRAGGHERSRGLPGRRRRAGASLEETVEAPGPRPPLRLLCAGGRAGRRGHEQGGETAAGVSAAGPGAGGGGGVPRARCGPGLPPARLSRPGALPRVEPRPRARGALLGEAVKGDREPECGRSCGVCERPVPWR